MLVAAPRPSPPSAPGSGSAQAPSGFAEGAARAAAQTLIYCIETLKTHQQIYGRLPVMSAAQWLEHIGRGMFSSVVSSGIVFGTYYSAYHRLAAAPSQILSALAGPVSTLATSVIKIPIGNSMRLLQAGIGRNMLDAGGRIVRLHGMRGLYGGYALSVAEDAIEWDMRERLYQALKNHPALAAFPPITVGVVLGALTGMLAAGITTPFDTLRSQIAYRNAGGAGGATAGATAGAAQLGAIMRDMSGAGRYAAGAALFRGARYRMLSCGVKSGLFYAILEAIRPTPPRVPPALLAPQVI